MKKLIAKLSIMMLIITAVFSTGSKALAEEVKPGKEFAELLSQEKAEEREYNSLKKNQAASGDYKCLMQYLQTSASDALYHSFSGAFIDEANNLVIRLDGFIGEEELKKLDWETEPVIENGTSSYFDDMSRLDKINEKLAEASRVSREETKDSECAELMTYYPCVDYSVKSGTINVRFAVPDHIAFENAIRIFKKVVDDNDGIEFRSATIEENTFRAASFAANPGSSITISGAGNYSLGFRARYDADGETNYGFVTCAHGNSIGQLVSLNPKYSGTVKSLGIIDKRILGGSVEPYHRQSAENRVCRHQIRSGLWRQPSASEELAGRSRQAFRNGKDHVRLLYLHRLDIHERRTGRSAEPSHRQRHEGR